VEVEVEVEVEKEGGKPTKKRKTANEEKQ